MPSLSEELQGIAPRRFIRGRFIGERRRGVERVEKFDETGARVAWIIGASDALLDRVNEAEWRAFEPRYRAWWAETQGADVRGVDTDVEGRAKELAQPVEEE